MITWTSDLHLSEICENINIVGYKMRDYYIYGLQMESRPHVRITPRASPSLKKLFASSPYVLEVKEVRTRYCGECDTEHTSTTCCCNGARGCGVCDDKVISIGLRLDIRQNIKVANKLIKTIIFAMENKLILGKQSKLNLGKSVRKTIRKVKVNSLRR